MKQTLPTLIATTLVVITPFLLSGCADNSGKTDKYVDIHGIWEQVGYGDVFIINKYGGEQYQYTRQTCINNDSFDNADLDEALSAIKVKNGHMFEAYLGPTAVFKSRFSRLDELPASCQKNRFLQIQTVTPTQQFKHFWHTFNDYYPFFDKRGVNWQQQYTTYQPLVKDTMDQAALFAVLSEMLAPLDDSHVSLESTNASFSPEQPSNLEVAMQQAFQQQSTITDFEVFTDTQLAKIQQVQGSYLSNIKQAGGPDKGVAIWGRIDDNIGYLQLTRMAGIDKNTDLSDIESLDGAKDLQAMKKIMQQVSSDLNDVEAMVLDIRLNSGGFDGVSLLITNHFATEKRRVLSKYTQNWQGRTANTDAYLEPQKPMFSMPVALLSSDMTVSAAEIFLMVMSSLPQVNIIGERSNGALSDILSKSLLNNMEVNLSNEIYLDYNGQNYEVSGVPVDISTTAFDLGGFTQGQDRALDTALTHLRAQIK